MRLHAAARSKSSAKAGALLIGTVCFAVSGIDSSAAMDMGGHAVQGAHFSFGGPAAPQPAMRTVAITMEGLKFRPETVHVKTGDIVHFVVTNASEMAHEFTLGDQAFQQAHRHHMAAMAGAPMHHHDANTVSVEAHETKDLTWAFDHPGEVEFDCDIPGHYEAGMKGTIIVE